jgi:hypothetical protein
MAACDIWQNLLYVQFTAACDMWLNLWSKWYSNSDHPLKCNMKHTLGALCPPQPRMDHACLWEIVVPQDQLFYRRRNGCNRYMHHAVFGTADKFKKYLAQFPPPIMHPNIGVQSVWWIIYSAMVDVCWLGTTQSIGSNLSDSCAIVCMTFSGMMDRCLRRTMDEAGETRMFNMIDHCQWLAELLKSA